MSCPRCNADVATGAAYCSQCGLQLQGGAAFEETSSRARSAVYAGLWRRIAAVVIDSVVLSILGVVVGVLLGVVMGLGRATPKQIAVAGWLVGFVGGAIYEIAFNASSFQGTVGKQALRIKVTDTQGERISVPQSIGRYFAKFVSSITLGVGFAMAGFTRRRQALHDLFAATFVVSNAASAELVAAAPPAPRVGPSTAALLILLGLVPYVLFGFAIALAYWYEVQQRAEIAESQLSRYPPVSQTDLEAGRRQVRAALFAVQPFKVTISERIASGLPPEEIVPVELRGALAVQSRNVESVDILKGAILIVFGGDALIGLAGQQLAIVPGRRPNGSVVWVCGYAPRPEGAVLFIEDYSEYTSVDEGYLPETCR